MAVTTTPTDLLEAAYAKSLKNNPGQILTEATEGLSLVIRIIRKFYAIAARVNPLYFAESNTVSFPGAGNPWPRPEGVESVFWIENLSGAEVVVVPIKDRKADSLTPSLYRLGKNYHSAGNANDPDPSSDNLVFWGSKRPDDPADITSTIDSMWEEQFNELLILEIGAELANKDGRVEEMAYLAAERDTWLRLFIMFLEHETVNVHSRWGSVHRFTTPSLIPLTDLLVGGTTVKIERGGN